MYVMNYGTTVMYLTQEVGKMMDSDDPRAKGFLHLIHLLRTMELPPEYLFVENVCNFEVLYSLRGWITNANEWIYGMEDIKNTIVARRCT